MKRDKPFKIDKVNLNFADFPCVLKMYFQIFVASVFASNFLPSMFAQNCCIRHSGSPETESIKLSIFIRSLRDKLTRVLPKKRGRGAVGQNLGIDFCADWIK